MKKKCICVIACVLIFTVAFITGWFAFNDAINRMVSNLPASSELIISTYDDNAGILTREKEVNYFNGRRETWYSSRALRHPQTDEWTLGYDGIYRDEDGYIVVATSDVPQGELIETSLGTGKAYDCSPTIGTVDIYTDW